MGPLSVDFQLVLSSMKMHVVDFCIVLNTLLGTALLGSYRGFCLFHSSDCDSSARKVKFGT